MNHEDYITVVNKRQPKDGHREYVGRPSPLGNPYPLSHYEREESIRLYKRWLWHKIIHKDEDVIRELDRLLHVYAVDGELQLECWCAPKACHADVIKRVLIWKLERQDATD